MCEANLRRQMSAGERKRQEKLNKSIKVSSDKSSFYAAPGAEGERMERREGKNKLFYVCKQRDYFCRLILFINWRLFVCHD
jgi:hypothetical protein